jgi:hypothetical protein
MIKDPMTIRKITAIAMPIANPFSEVPKFSEVTSESSEPEFSNNSAALSLRRLVVGKGKAVVVDGEGGEVVVDRVGAAVVDRVGAAVVVDGVGAGVVVDGVVEKSDETSNFALNFTVV